MNSKLSLFCAFAGIALFAFSFGYWWGSQQAFTHPGPPLKDLSSENQQTSLSSDNGSKFEFTINKFNLDIPPENNSDDQHSIDTEDTSDLLPSNLKLAPNASINEMLTFLSLISASDNKEDIKQIGPTLELLITAVSEDPNNLQMLADFYVYSDDSATPFSISHILQNANIQDLDIVINNMVERLSAQGTSIADQKLLHLVSNNSDFQDNEQIIYALKNIALYKQTDNINKIYALDLLPTYQFDSEEKSKIVSDLTFALEQSPSEEVSYMIENIVRFSDRENRTKLASDYLNGANPISVRIAILSTMHTGAVKPNEILKATLFNIAQNTNDPLSNHARDTLVHVFEIDKNEYKQLQNGG